MKKTRGGVKNFVGKCESGVYGKCGGGELRGPGLGHWALLSNNGLIVCSRLVERKMASYGDTIL